MSEPFAEALMEVVAQLAPVREAVTGYKAALVQAGMSTEAAEAMAVDAHRWLMQITFQQVVIG